MAFKTVIKTIGICLCVLALSPFETRAEPSRFSDAEPPAIDRDPSSVVMTDREPATPAVIPDGATVMIPKVRRQPASVSNDFVIVASKKKRSSRMAKNNRAPSSTLKRLAKSKK